MEILKNQATPGGLPDLKGNGLPLALFFSQLIPKYINKEFLLFWLYFKPYINSGIVFVVVIITL